MTTARKKLPTEAEAEAPKAEADTAEAWVSQLRAPFPPEQVGKLPRITCRECSRNGGQCGQHRRIKCEVCGRWHSPAVIHLDYVGHADITARLLDVDPHWTWEPFTAQEIGNLPPGMRDAGLWIHLTVRGVTRIGFGDAQGKQGPNAIKEAIGDALRNAAMRFGAGLELWAKGDRDFTHAKDETPEPSAPQEQQPPQPQPAERRPSATDEARTSPEGVAFWKAFDALSPDDRAKVQDSWPWSMAPGAFTAPKQYADGLAHIRKATEAAAPAAQEAAASNPFPDEPPF